ncbi:MAG: hypothetical protein ACJ8GN_16570 [Longimicrobiaceae bacterium]
MDLEETIDLADMSLRDRVRAVLLGKLGRGCADAGPLGAAAADAGTRQRIARAIRLEFPNLRPPWCDADLGPGSTLDSMAHEIGRRRIAAPAPRWRR